MIGNHGGDQHARHEAYAETIDGLIGSLRAGQAGGYEWVSTPFFIDLALRRP